MRALAATALLVTVLCSVTTGCSKKKDADEDSTAEPRGAPAPAPKATGSGRPGPHHAPAPAAHPGGPPVLGELIQVPLAHVQFNAPGGWNRNTTSNGWSMFRSPDNHARLGFVAFDQPGEATSRLGQLAEAFDLTNLVWGSPSDGYAGRDKFPAHIGETRSCTMRNGDPCDMRYMTINPGGTEQMMVVYLVNLAHGEALRSHAKASVDSLRRM